MSRRQQAKGLGITTPLSGTTELAFSGGGVIRLDTSQPSDAPGFLSITAPRPHRRGPRRRAAVLSPVPNKH